ncbi:DUF6923 family protein [Arthrobacter sp. NamB2]|uniref:DUF7507 domain-containing protein n=1 Tax=Arthrobacter sp. NamB2 TaxID=2576035 RepID=UPI0016792C24|nr:DUF11 domain-containing protein [Arthrobacter sp. NamB2]
MSAVTALLAFSFAGTSALGPAAAPAQAAPGTPGTPSAPTVIYAEDFENVPGIAPVQRLTDYVGATGQRYTADPAWLRFCSGWIAAAEQDVNAPGPVADCQTNNPDPVTNARIWWNQSQQLARGIGLHRGQTLAQSVSNNADTAFSAVGVPAGLTEFQTATNIPLAAGSRFLSFSTDVAAVNCQLAHPLLQFQLINDQGAATNVGSVIDGCASPKTVAVPAQGLAGASTVTVGTYSSNGALLYSGASVGVRMLNQQPNGNGNDHTIDNIQILDVTPQLDKSFTPAELLYGEVSTLNLTVTNTSELGAKNGWSFTDALPAGLSVGDGAAATTCPAGVVTAPAGATSIGVTGNLNAGQASCTVTVNVVADAPGSYTNGPDNITSTGLNDPGESTVEFSAPSPFACDAGGYLFQTPSAGNNLLQRVDLVSGEYETVARVAVQTNANGYNTLDNYFYGIGNTGHLIRIHADGTHVDLGVPAGMPATSQNIGDFDAAGHYWVTSSVSSTSPYYEIDLVPGSPTYGTVVGSGPRNAAVPNMGADWGFTNGAFYSVSYDGATGPNNLVRFDPATGTSSVVSPLILPDGTQLTGMVAGAVYVDAAGYLYASHNNTGEIYRIDVTTGDTIFLSQGPAASSNDGARCALAAIPTLTVEKTVEGRQAPADQFTVGLQDAAGTVLAEATTTGTATTASTVNQPVSQGATYTITDTMAAGSASAINAYTTGIECLNTATGATVPATGTGPWSVTIPAAADFTCEVTNAAVPVGAELVKSADAAAQENIEAGQVITYSFAFTNTGDVPLTDIRIDETEFTGTGTAPVATCPTTTVAPDATVTCTATYTVTQADVDRGSISNEATGTGTPPPGFPNEPSVPSNKVIVPNEADPELSIVKSASAETVTAAGQDITYSFLVTNTGNVTLSDVAVVEGEFSGSGELSEVTCPEGAASLAPAASVTCTATYTTTQADVDAGVIENEATATGTPPGSNDPIESVPDSSTVGVDRAPALTVTKSADAAAVENIRVGQEVTYSFVATNTGNVTLSDVTVVDGEFSGAGELSEVTCPTEGAASLAPGAFVTCTATYTVVQADVDAGRISNTATGTGTPPPGTELPPVTSNEVTVPGARTPELSIVKTASDEAITAAGQDVTYSFMVTNTGNVTIEDVAVVEGEFTGTGELSEVTCPEGAASLAPGAFVTCTATYTTTQADVDAGVIENEATATGTPPGTNVPISSDPDGVTVTIPADPELSIVKTASAETITAAGQNVTYSFLVTNTGNVTLTDVTVVEGEFTGTGELSAVTCPEGAASLAPGTSVTCTATYVTTQADVTAGSITNTATGSSTIPGGGNLVSSPSTAIVTAEDPAVVPPVVPEVPGTPERPVTPVAPVVPAQPVATVPGKLATTGFQGLQLALGALAVIGLGAASIAVAKRKRGQA